MPVLSEVNSINDKLWTVTISIQPGSLSQADAQLLAKFGEPSINTGATLESGGLAYTLPNNYIRVVSDMPYIQTFDSSTAPFNQGFSNTALQVNAFITYFNATYLAAFVALRTNVDTWSGQSLVTI